MQWLLLILILPYLYLLLKIYRSLASIKPDVPSQSAGLFVSVVIACRNEEYNLPLLLHDLSEQESDPNLFEVIIIDDGSSDRTFEIASKFNGLLNLKVLKNTGAGKKPAVRTGISASGADLIITTDADCRVGKRWISTITSFYSENKPDLIICPVNLETGSGFFHKFQELEYLSLQGVTAGTAAEGNPVMCNGANLAFTKEIYNKNSGNLHYEIPSGDDVFLLHSIKRDPVNKIRWLESQEVMVTTQSQNTIGSFIKQRVRWTSKAGAYKDKYTRVLAIVTFITILLLWFLLVAGVFNRAFLPVLLVAFILKSLPDFLILQNTSFRYGRKNLLTIFLPGQIIYPVYVLSVFLFYLIGRPPSETSR